MDVYMPKIFISYSWAVQAQVIELAERLSSHGVDVVLDVWDLKEGHDKFAFMEQCVSNPSIAKVLIICDRTYAEKANSRQGGAGDETAIISPEVYGNEKQEKFIPVIFENDDAGNPYVPVYIKSRIYIDLSAEESKYELEYEKLLRNIHNKPLYRKPSLGKMPEWLLDESPDVSPLKNIVRQLKSCTSSTKGHFLIKDAMGAFISGLLEFKDYSLSSSELVKKINETKPLRDTFLDFVEELIKGDYEIVTPITSFFENIYNEAHQIETGVSTYSNATFELFDYFIWESFVCAMAILIHYEKYSEIFDILNHTYFRRSTVNGQVGPQNFIEFREYFQTLEEYCKPKSDNPNNQTLAGAIAVQREKRPLITDQTFANADTILYQLSKVFFVENNYWFPTTYIYFKGGASQWIKLKSKSFCKRIFPLFGVSTIEELKMKIQSSNPQSANYSRSFRSAPEILSGISANDIGILN